MPTLLLKISPAQTPARHRALADALTRLTGLHLGKREEVTAVLIDEFPAMRWFIAGHPTTRAIALLEISVTAGTNTLQQKAAFIEAVFAELEAQLGAAGLLDPASYVIVRELPATDWGYGGVTQKARQVAPASAEAKQAQAAEQRAAPREPASRAGEAPK